MSLSHIGLVPAVFCVSDSVGYEGGFGFCLGHGLSACLTFAAFWFFSSFTYSRKMFLMKRLFSCFPCSEVVLVLSFCLGGSFPSRLQFFYEVFVVCCSGGSLILFFLSFYLFFSASVVFGYLGYLLVRGRSVFPLGGVSLGSFCFLCFLGFVCFTCFVFV